MPGPRPLFFDDFYRSHRDTVAKALALTLGDDDLGYEAADEAMTRAYESWESIAAYDNPQGWLYRTGLNWARSWLRRRKRGAAKDPLVALADRITDRPADSDLARAVAKLPDSFRAVVVLRFYCDWSVESTADGLGVPTGTVKSRLNRALKRLEDELAPNPTDGGPR